MNPAADDEGYWNGYQVSEDVFKHFHRRINMLGGIIGSVVGPAVEKLLDLIPDPNARAEAREQAEKEIREAIDKAQADQREINKIEAAHPSVFIAGWRPCLGWLAAISIGWTYVGYPVALFGARLAGSDVTLPWMDSAPLMELVVAMLGLAGLRTYEKRTGTEKNR